MLKRVLSFILISMLVLVAGTTVLANSEGDWLHFTILHTNDEHSSLIPHSPAIDHLSSVGDDPTVGGFARVATVIDEIRSEKINENEPVLVFNAGDFLGGSAFGWLAPAGYAAELTLLQEMGYDAVTIGNHEYDYGTEVLAEYFMTAGYPKANEKTIVIASNTKPPEDHPLAEKEIIHETNIFELGNGIKVGVFGLLGIDAELVTYDTGEFVFLDRVETAKKMVEKLNSQSVDVIVLLSHSGVKEDVELAKNVEGIDVIVGGHCHTALFQPVIEGETIIIQAGALTRYLGRIELAYNPDTGEVKPDNDENELFLIPIDGTIQPDPEISMMIEEYTDKLNQLVKEMTGGLVDDVMKPIIKSGFPIKDLALQESPVGNFITDGMRMITEEVTGERVDVAIMANGSIRGTITPGTMPVTKGLIPFYEIVEVIGLGYGDDGYAGYSIVSVYLTGDELARLLEVDVLLKELMGNTYFIQFSGLRYNYNPKNAILFTIPIMDQPLPSTRAVTKGEIYTGEGIQPATGDEGYKALKKGDDELYHVVTDSYILSFLPMIGDILPSLEIVPKHADGEPIDLSNRDEYVVSKNGMDLKVWETVVKYAMAQEKGEDDLPVMHDYYSDKAGRINEVKRISYMQIAGLTLAGITAALLIFFLAK
ncbi:MAG: bifunctional UDP-sugar hydrolase/5'-nucleotidase [Thermotogota bacterium]|nr:bifunctional UDP-sugar hydrolase/5'-nucleotidase [Thermotogota bacterium]